MRSAGFEGWRCNRKFGEGFDLVVAYMKANISAKDSLFVYPDAMILYGATGHESYRGAPLAIDQTFPGPVMGERFRQRFVSSPPQWVVLHKLPDMQEVFEPEKVLQRLGLAEFLQAHYMSHWQWGDYTLLRYKSP